MTRAIPKGASADSIVPISTLIMSVLPTASVRAARNISRVALSLQSASVGQRFNHLTHTTASKSIEISIREVLRPAWASKVE